MNALHKIVVELCERLKHETIEKDKYQSLLRELLDAQSSRKSERLSKDQLALFESVWQQQPEAAEDALADEPAEQQQTPPEQTTAEATEPNKRAARQPLARHLVRERVIYDLAQEHKHCRCCGKDLRLIAEETSERYEFIPAVMKVIEDVRLKYACDCAIRTANKPSQPIEKSTASASVLAQVIVSKFADHLPLHRQQRIFQRHGVEISRKTMGGWLASVAQLMEPLYQAAKKVLLGSKVIGTDDTGVKVLDRKLDFARTGRIWPYVGDRDHRVILYDYTPTRGRDGPARFLETYQGNLQADAYVVYDAFFRPGRGLVEVGCWMHARRYFHKALESDAQRMGVVLHLIAKLYSVEDRAGGLRGGQRLELRKRLSVGVMAKLHEYLLRIQKEVLPKSPAATAVRYTLNQWDALNRYLADGDLEIDNGAVERANRGVAVGRGNWTFFGSDNGGRTAAVLMSFVATCQSNEVEPFAWFRDVLSRLGSHPVNRVDELLPHRWKLASTSGV